MNFRWFAPLVVSAALLMLLPGLRRAEADGGSVASLRKQVELLQRDVHTLQKQVKALQQRQLPAPVADSPSNRPERGNTAAERTVRSESSDSIPVIPSTMPSIQQATTPAEIKKRWHTLERGMSTKAVARLLGNPSRTFKLSGKPIWYYDYQGIGVSSIMFSTDGSIIDWQAPPSSWQW